MKSRLLAASAATATIAMAASVQAEELTLCWAAWDPANALVELSKDFEAQSGHTMKFEFVPWPNFADRMLNELNSGGKLCDLLIGDSQWIGGGAENGHYVKLNDFFDANGISMDDFAPATVYAYSTWPKGTPNYYALPAMGDANGWFYRKDWFARPEIQEEFKAKYGRDLAEPKTQKELLEIAQFFQGREIDGQTVYGASIFTERGSEGITMGATGALYAWGFKYENTPGKYDMEGAVNSPEAVEALEFYKEFYRTATPPGYDNAYMEQSLDAFKSGQVAMAMNWFAFFPGLYADPNTGGDKIDFFVNPAQNVAASTLGGRGFRSSPIAKSRMRRWNISNGSPSLMCRRNGGRWAAIPATRPSWTIRDSRTPRPSPATSSMRWRAFRTSGRSRPMPRFYWPCRNGSTTSSSPIRAPRKRRSTG